MRLLKTITLLLFLTLLVAFTLSGTILQLYQAHARYVMEEKLELESLVTVNNLNPSSITWIKKGKEILLNGFLFDIKHIRENADGTINLQGLFDKDEQAIVMALKNGNDNSSDNTAKKLLTHIFQQVLIYNQHNNYNLQLYKIINKKLASYRNIYIALHCKEIPTPPPQA